MKIAVIGSGIAGASAAWLLSKFADRAHQVTLFEQNDYLGGHTNTINVTLDGVTAPVDTGFLVFNDWTYPNLIAMFKHLGVADALSDMSFSVKLTDGDHSRLEWSGSNLATVFAQPANLLKPKFWAMLRDIVRFNREATGLVTSNSAMPGTVGEFLRANRYSTAFRDWYLSPMAGCVWSTPTQKIDDFPLATLLTFCHNHGLLSVSNRPQWRTVSGGTQTYTRALIGEPSDGRLDVRLNAGVSSVVRHLNGVSITANNLTETYDQIVFACHTDQTLRILADATGEEKRILSAIPYQPNTAILHTDTRVLPVRRRAWASWNYHAAYTSTTALTSSPMMLSTTPSGNIKNEFDGVSLSYLINRLQPLPFKTPVIVTMNPRISLDPAKIIKTIQYDHPVFLAASVGAKRELRALQGQRRSWFAGAWTRYGFHEDGLMSGIAVAKALGATVPWQTDVPAANDLVSAYPGVDD
jgi:predicted NAD/FAD-binding protein